MGIIIIYLFVYLFIYLFIYFITLVKKEEMIEFTIMARRPQETTRL